MLLSNFQAIRGDNLRFLHSHRKCERILMQLSTENFVRRQIVANDRLPQAQPDHIGVNLTYKAQCHTAQLFNYYLLDV